MKQVIVAISLVLIFITAFAAEQNDRDLRLYDLNRGRKTFLSEAIAGLKQNRIILVGEYHSNKNHHFAQLDVIRALKNNGAQVAIGLEMFRSNSQQALDRWIKGDIAEKEFQEIYYDNWNFPWPLYRMIFEYARQNRIPMVGLNVPGDITRQVAQEGFQSLSPDQKGKLSDVTCRVDQEYMNFIKNAYGAHGHGQMNFTHFCEAQLVWDTAMAINALDYLKANPDRVMVIIAGSGHARKGAIPRQIRERTQIPYAVILPEVKDSIDPNTVSEKDADYIIMDLMNTAS